MTAFLLSPRNSFGIRGQASFTTPGNYSWTVPDNVYNISFVAVGAGGRGYSSTYPSTTIGQAGGGGGLIYYNGLSVTPGTTLQLTVGAPPPVNYNTASQGARYQQIGNTYIVDVNNNYYIAQAGESFVNAVSLTGLGGYCAGGYGSGPAGTVIRRGGSGGTYTSAVGATTWYGGGGGSAAGYSADGVSGGSISVIAIGNVSYTNGVNGRGGSGGGGDAQSTSYGIGGTGGGVGIFGEGVSGLGGTGTLGYNGSAGSGGVGVLYGGGSGGAGYSVATGSNSVAGNGAIRIIWGQDRYFPNTNTIDL